MNEGQAAALLSSGIAADIQPAWHLLRTLLESTLSISTLPGGAIVLVRSDLRAGLHEGWRCIFSASPPDLAARVASGLLAPC